jgi:hypothetical protein
MGGEEHRAAVAVQRALRRVALPAGAGGAGRMSLAPARKCRWVPVREVSRMRGSVSGNNKDAVRSSGAALRGTQLDEARGLRDVGGDSAAARALCPRLRSSERDAAYSTGRCSSWRCPFAAGAARSSVGGTGRMSKMIIHTTKAIPRAIAISSANCDTLMVGFGPSPLGQG